MKGKLYLALNNSLLFIEAHWKLIIIGVFALALIFSVSTCRHHKNDANNQKAVAIWNEAKYDSLINSKGTKVLEAKVAVTTDEKFTKNESAKVFDLKKKDEKKIKKVIATGEIDQEFVIKDDFIPFTPNPDDYFLYNENIESDTLSLLAWPQFANLDSTFKVGDTFTKSDSSYTIKATLAIEDKKKGLVINNLVAKDSIYWRIAVKKNGLFKQPETVAQVINSNPHFELTGTRTMVLKNKVSTWNKIIKPVLFAAGGLFIGSKVIK